MLHDLAQYKPDPQALRDCCRTPTERDLLMAALRYLLKSGPLDARFGVCMNLSDYFVAHHAEHGVDLGRRFGLSYRAVGDYAPGSTSPIRLVVAGQRLWAGAQRTARRELLQGMLTALGEQDAA